MAKVVALNGALPPVGSGVREPVPEVVAALERLLAQAKSGELAFFAMAYELSDRMTWCHVGGVQGGFTMIGTIRVMEASLLDGYLRQDPTDA
jgi:hypothetical protein